MDVGGSFLELSCVRIALIPAGASIPDHRFEQLTSYLTAFREVPVSALPRRAAVPRMTGNATFSAMPAALREALSEASPASPLLRSHSASKDVGRSSQPSSFPSIRKSVSRQGVPKSTVEKRFPERSHSSARLEKHSIPFQRTRDSRPMSLRHAAELNMKGAEIDSSFRLRYDIIHRDHSGVLVMKPFSEWDDFHSSKILGVFGIVDCTHPEIGDNQEQRKQAIFDAYDDFNSALDNFKDASVRRLIVFTSQDAGHEDAPFVLNDPKSPAKNAKPATTLHFSVGYVPERSRYEETRLEVRAQIIHFAGLLLHSLDRDCWKRRESPPTDLFLSPIDERHSADRQPKLSKRRPGRLDKLLGDNLLLMGSPGEALTRYNSAIEKAKANSDRLWLAGAMEGWSAAHVLTYVGSGGSVNDPLLSDRLIEHYGEIYKLYQKKRVAEPEAAAALRLAEFLGRYTSRRKDALDAAEHAATVGEGLRMQKRAVLWEALARFSDWMGCRRKAALYLYRLGHMNASQAVWSSAVTLMIASERQLTKSNQKPWAGLNRRVLLTAAQHAEEAGDMHTAARLRVESLVINPQGTLAQYEGDESLIKALSTVQVPAYLPAAIHVLGLADISALQIKGLNVRSRVEESNGSQSTPRSKDGPFIYNPFEAKKRAKAEAVARRAVTWVCGEPAQVGMRLFNQLTAELTVDVIAVILVSAGADGDSETGKPAVLGQEDMIGDDCNNESTANESTGHGRYIRSALKRTNKIAESVQESFVLPPKDSKNEKLQKITVIPKRTGPFYVDGVLVRLFKGALVILRKEREANAPPVNVIAALPQLRLTSYSADGGTLQNLSSRTPPTVYIGERKCFRVDIEKTGNEPIAWMKAKVLSSDSEVLAIVKNELESEDVLDGLARQSATKSFIIEVLGKRGVIPVEKWSPDYMDNDQGLPGSKSVTISVNVEYEGLEASGVVRESGTHVKMMVLPAIEVRKIDVCRYVPKSGEVQLNDASGIYVHMEVKNYVSAPATVSLSPFHNKANPARSDIRADIFSGETCLVEEGASVRLMCTVVLDENKLVPEKPQGPTCSKSSGTISHYVHWNVPALGRRGYITVEMEEISSVLAPCATIAVKQVGSVANLACLAPHVARAELAISINSDCNKMFKVRETELESSIPVGTFCSSSVHIWNRSNSKLPEDSVLDINITQNDGHGPIHETTRVVIVGATERIHVGPLPPRNGYFEHKVRIRFPSTGTYQIEGILYDTTMQQYREQDTPSVIGEERSSCVSANLTHSEEYFAKAESLPSGSSALLRGSVESNEPNGKVGASSHELDLEPPASFHRESDTPGGLKRVGLSRKVRLTGERTAQIVIYPTTVDTYPSSPAERPSVVLGFCSVSSTAVQEAPSLTENMHFVSSPPHHNRTAVDLSNELTSIPDRTYVSLT